MVAVAEAGVRGTGGCPRREGCWAGAVTPSAWPRNKPRKAIPAARRRVIAPEWEAAVRDGERPWRTPRGVGMIWAPAGGALRYARATGGARPARRGGVWGDRHLSTARASGSAIQYSGIRFRWKERRLMTLSFRAVEGERTSRTRIGFGSSVHDAGGRAADGGITNRSGWATCSPSRGTSAGESRTSPWPLART